VSGDLLPRPAPAIARQATYDFAMATDQNPEAAMAAIRATVQEGRELDPARTPGLDGRADRRYFVDASRPELAIAVRVDGWRVLAVVPVGEAGAPAPVAGPFVTLHAQTRWRERVQPGVERGEAIAPLKRIVQEGREVTERPAWGGEWRPREARYFAHPDWPGVLAVVGRDSGAVVTVSVDPRNELPTGPSIRSSASRPTSASSRRL